MSYMRKTILAANLVTNLETNNWEGMNDFGEVMGHSEQSSLEYRSTRAPGSRSYFISQAGELLHLSLRFVKVHAL